MEEFLQDQETVIQQLRLLLAAKEEELHALKGRAEKGGGEDGADSIAGRLLTELEEKKEEIAELAARLKDHDARAKEKLARLASELDEKEKLIASLQAGPAQVVVEDEEARRRIGELEERLREKEALLEEARETAAQAATAAGDATGAPADGGVQDRGAAGDEEARAALAEARAETERLGEELRESRIVRAKLEHAAEERDRARAEAARLAEELSAMRAKLEETERGHAARVAELQQRLDLLQGSIDAAAAAAGAASSNAGAEAAKSEAESLPVFQRIRTLEAELEDRELAYRTTQIKLHRTSQNQQILRGLCAGLCVFLIFIISMKARQSGSAVSEVAHETFPLDAMAAAPEAPRPPAPPVRLARGPALNDDDFLPVPEAELVGMGAAPAGPVPAPTTAVAQAPAAPAAESSPPDDTSSPAAETRDAETKIAAQEPPGKTALPVDTEFVEASTLALGPAASPVVAPARDASKVARAKGAAEAVSPQGRSASHPSGPRFPYTVKKGESLWTICQRELGNGGAIGRVARENKIANPNTVKAGDVIYLSRQ